MTRTLLPKDAPCVPLLLPSGLSRDWLGTRPRDLLGIHVAKVKPKWHNPGWDSPPAHAQRELPASSGATTLTWSTRKRRKQLRSGRGSRDGGEHGTDATEQLSPAAERLHRRNDSISELQADHSARHLAVPRGAGIDPPSAPEAGDYLRDLSNGKRLETRRAA